MPNGIQPVVVLMNNFCDVLTDMERNGIAIDQVELARLKEEYEAEQEVLEKELHLLAAEAMGDTPFNLDSPTQLSEILFSRTVRDRKQWTRYFDLQNERRRRVRPETFGRLVNTLTDVIYKTTAHACDNCNGYGRMARRKKDGSFGAVRFRCPVCSGTGVVYKSTGKVAGFKLIPRSSDDVTANGFTTQKDKIEELLTNATGNAKTFLEKMARFNAVSHYLSNFVSGIERNIRPSGLLHTSFMQCVTSTGRLSSRDPNYQNQPRGATFPIRRVVVSRWRGGKITEADFEQLEFRVAAELSGCAQAAQDIKDKIDVHIRTATILTEAGQQTDRQAAKPHTFKPLYGGLSGTKAEVVYYKAFLDRYVGVREWHDFLCATAVRDHRIVLPSGRAYAFPYAKQYPGGGVSGGTKIKNYPVQGFATADIVPLATIIAARQLQSRNAKSLLINQVHDSNVVDAHPDEINMVPEVLAESFLSVSDKVKELFGYTMVIPLGVEVKQGDNWLDMKKVA